MPQESARPIYLRHDIDNDIDRAYKIAKIEREFDIRATFFILNTAPYWGSRQSWHLIQAIQDMGHEVAWHNNIITEFLTTPIQGHARPEWMRGRLLMILDEFIKMGIYVRGSASHGDRLCRTHGYLNYDVFQDCPRVGNGIEFGTCDFTIPKVSMKEFALEYEAYHVPYDAYLSESGGKRWNQEFTSAYISKVRSLQILIHPQHWKL